MRYALALALVLLASSCGGTSEARGKHYRVPSSTMEPTLHCARPGVGCLADQADEIIVQADPVPQRGDVVVFQTPQLALRECGAAGKFVKRLVGLPGEVWAERDGFVYINGHRLAEPYVAAPRRDSMTLTLRDLPPKGKLRRIPADFYLVLGDNRASSCDSRIWGLVPRENLIGKVVEIKRGSKLIDFR